MGYISFATLFISLGFLTKGLFNLLGLDNEKINDHFNRN